MKKTFNGWSLTKGQSSEIIGKTRETPQYDEIMLHPFKTKVMNCNMDEDSFPQKPTSHSYGLSWHNARNPLVNLPLLPETIILLWNSCYPSNNKLTMDVLHRKQLFTSTGVEWMSVEWMTNPHTHTHTHMHLDDIFPEIGGCRLSTCDENFHHKYCEANFYAGCPSWRNHIYKQWAKKTTSQG